MKRFYSMVTMVVMAMVVLFGCQAEQTEPKTNESNQEQKVEQKVEVQLVKDDKAETVEVVIEEGQSAMDVTKKAFDTVEENGFVTTLNGIETGEKDKSFWSLSVNGEEAMVGAKDIEVKEGDEIVWTFSNY